MIYKLDFLFVPVYADWTESFVFRDSTNTPLTWTTTRDFEMRIGREKRQGLGAPTLIMSERLKTLERGGSSTGILYFYFKKNDMSKLSTEFSYFYNLTRLVNGVRLGFCEGTITLAADVGS